MLAPLPPLLAAAVLAAAAALVASSPLLQLRIQTPFLPLPAGSHTLHVDGRLLATNRLPFQPHDDRLVQALDAAYTRNLTDALHSKPWLSRHYARATDMQHARTADAMVVSPSEARALAAAHITMAEVDDIARFNYFAYAIVTLGCLGRYQAPDGTEVAYLTASSRSWDNTRTQIEALYHERGGVEGGFVADRFQGVVLVGVAGEESAVDASQVGLAGACVPGVALAVGSPF